MRILCLGNSDNVGIRTYLWLKEAGESVTLYRLKADEDPKRGNPLFYIDEKELNSDKNIREIALPLLYIRNISIFSSQEIIDIQNNYDIVIITGGWHALLYSRRINLPKIFMPVGYEIHQKAREYRGIPTFKEIFITPIQTLRNYFYGWLTRNSLLKVTKILDWFPPTVAINKSLGFADKIIYMAFGEDVEKNKSLVKQGMLDNLNVSTVSAKRIFLWFSRINFLDPAKANYKGADLFIKALENFEPSLNSGELIVYMSNHGEEKKQFEKFVTKSQAYRYIRWLEHLDYSDLLTCLSIKNAVLFTDFGLVNSGISGIGRDGYTIGIPMVNSNTEEMMIKQYSAPGPRTYAFTIDDITQAMRKFLVIDDKRFLAKKEETLAYGMQYIDKSFFISRILKEASNLVNKK